MLQDEIIFPYRSIHKVKSEFDSDMEIAFQSLYYFCLKRNFVLQSSIYSGLIALIFIWTFHSHIVPKCVNESSASPCYMEII